MAELTIVASQLARSRQVTLGRLASILGMTEITNATWDDLESMLIQADVGMATTQEIIHEARERTNTQGLTRARELMRSYTNIVE